MSAMLWVREQYRPLFAAERTVEDFMRIPAVCVKHVVAARRTGRFERAGRAFYLKAHYGVGWGELLKNWLQLKTPVTGARDEWRALQRLEQLEIAAPRAVAYGLTGTNPARQRSFLITEAIPDSVDLAHWTPVACTPDRDGWRWKQRLIDAVAALARGLHEQGINHRDFYLCHIRLPCTEATAAPPAAPTLYVLDLHRAQLRTRTPLRWCAKDLAALLYSALEAGLGSRLTRRDLYRFAARYTGLPWRQSLIEQRPLWTAVHARAARLARRDAAIERALPRLQA